MNIIGRLTKNATVFELDDQRQVVNFSVATDESYRNKSGEKVKQTTYFDCSYWVSAAVAQYLTKGKLVELSGRVTASAWIDKEGNPRAGLNFHTSQIKLHTGRAVGDDKKDKAKATDGSSQDAPDDLPF